MVTLLEKSEQAEGDQAKSDDKDGKAKEEEEENAEDEGEKGQDGSEGIVARMNLKDLFLSGINLVESSNEYQHLFKEKKGAMNSIDIKLLELRLELCIWDRG